jgi:OHCU decarboxylase
MRFATPQGFNSGDQFYTYLKDSFDVLYGEGQAGAAKMLSIGLHCRLIGRPGRAAALKRFIEYAKSHDKVWFARRIEIAEHWNTNHPPASDALTPSMMDEAEFISHFGGVFEHSPWIPEQAYGGELGPAHDTAIGIHSALTRVFRQASDQQRLDVLNAHPDLAGKLAEAKRLTQESTEEQASAGLSALTDEERMRFGDLNSTYTAKFGFPFILAVKGRSKAEILTSFETRIENDADAEFAQACRQVERIAYLRCLEKFSE